MAKKILIIDDSALMRRVISDIINSSKQYEVMDMAGNGLEGLNKIAANPKLYDAVLLDINMPKMNGLEMLEELQRRKLQQTIIMVSTVAKEGAKETIRALELGAFDFVTKPENFIETRGEDFKQSVLAMLDVATSGNVKMDLVTTMPETKKAFPWGTSSQGTSGRENPLKEKETGKGSVRNPLFETKEKAAAAAGVSKTAGTVKMSERSAYKRDRKNRLVALACSTGGPKSLQQVIPYIPEDIDSGIVIVQHMPVGFTKSLAARLNEMSKVTVKEAEHDEPVNKGTVYIAPGGKHLRLVKSGNGTKIALSDEPPVDALRPCANIMYESLKDSPYDEIICVVLTGMGADGTKGITSLKAAKHLHVIAQNEATSIVYGMPRAVAEAGLVDEVKPLDEIADAITRNTGVR